MNPPPPPPTTPLPELTDDLTGEILLRLPLDDPACLVRASLVCKPWRRLLSSPAFLRRYRAFHRTPPVLGFIRNMETPMAARFVPTTSIYPPNPDHRDCYALDSRHGRVLMSDLGLSSGLLVWDPITGEKHRLRHPHIPGSYYNAAVLCAAAECDHLDCHGGPFLVAYVGTEEDNVAHACLYSSETGQWSSPTTIDVEYYVEMLPPVLVGGALHFICQLGHAILRYDLGGDRDLTVIDRPDAFDDGIALMPAEDGGLEFAGLDMFSLHMWSLRTGIDGVEGWAHHRFIELDMLPVDALEHSPYLIGFAKGPDSGIIFVSTAAGVFTIELKSKRAKKVCDETRGFYAVFPYTSFCTPDRTSGKLPSPAAN